MFHILYGDDEFTRSEALSEMKEVMGPPELRDVNVAVFKAAEVDFGLLTSTCETVPFLSERRMVIVEGLLSMFERGRRRRPNQASQAERSLGEWESLPERVAALPSTTYLVLVDGRLTTTNPLFSRLRRLAEVRTFSVPRWNELQEWVRRRAAARQIDIEADAVRALANAVGPNLRVMDNELQKLSLYCMAKTVKHEDVREIVSYAREASIFPTIDAIVEGRPGVGIRLVHRLMESGEASAYLIVMIARQVRLLLLAKALRSQGASPARIGESLSLSGYPLRKTLDQETKLSERQLVSMHHKLLEADHVMKTTPADEGLVLDLLIAGLASTPT